MTTHPAQTIDKLSAIFRVDALDLRIGDIKVVKQLAFEVYPGETVGILEPCNLLGWDVISVERECHSRRTERGCARPAEKICTVRPLR